MIIVIDNYKIFEENGIKLSNLLGNIIKKITTIQWEKEKTIGYIKHEEKKEENIIFEIYKFYYPGPPETFDIEIIRKKIG